MLRTLALLIVLTFAANSSYAEKITGTAATVIVSEGKILSQKIDDSLEFDNRYLVLWRSDFYQCTTDVEFLKGQIRLWCNKLKQTK